jgi:hypothetical protein
VTRISKQFIGSIDEFILVSLTTTCMIDGAVLFYWAAGQHLLIKMHDTMSALFFPSEFIDFCSGGSMCV